MKTYNTAIKDIAGVHEVTTFYQIFERFDEIEDNPEPFIYEQLASIRSEKSRKKVSWAINNSLLKFINEDHHDLVLEIYSTKVPALEKSLCFFWHFILTNRLFREISVDVFAKIYFSGRATISQDDIIPYLKELTDEGSNQLFSDNTIYRLATKYLSLLTKLHFVTDGRTKHIQYVRPSSEAIVLFLYFMKLHDSSMANVLNSKLLPLMFVSMEDVHEKLKKLSLKGLFNISFNGVDLKVELTHTYQSICDVLFN